MTRPRLFLLWYLTTCTCGVLANASTLSLDAKSSPSAAKGSDSGELAPGFLGSTPLKAFNNLSGSQGHRHFLHQHPEILERVGKAHPELRRPIVSLPVDSPTKSFWLDTPGANPLAETGSTGELTRGADVCIIGGGMTGVSAAWHLSKLLHEEVLESEGDKQKPSVVILEARQFCSGATGRNGGHLTRNVFSSFLSRQAAYNTSEAIKSYLIEKYTAEALLQFITDRHLEDEVDLVEGGHVTIFRTEEEESDARKDYEAAKAAGLDAGGDMGVKWIGNEELTEKYGLDPKLNYTGVFFVGHNLWPCKLVTKLFQDAQSSPNNVDVSLHTKTPITGISRRHIFDEGDTQPVQTAYASDQVPISTQTEHNRRRWTLDTPRGRIGCTYVIHATNGYAGHLLPFLSGIDPPETCPAPSDVASGSNGGRPPPPGEEHPPVPLPHPHPDRPDAEHPFPRGVYGITPTRGQVGAVRASVGPSELGWLNSWDGGGGGWEYWFPRYQDTNALAAANGIGAGVDMNSSSSSGGSKRIRGGRLEMGIADDSVLNQRVSTALREFLPRFFPGQFAPLSTEEEEAAEVIQPLGGEDPWEMEWTGIMGFTKTGDPFVGPVVPFPDSFGSETVSENEYEGQYIAAGYTGHGMPRAYAWHVFVTSLL
ncbi:FAD dependent oxidoreductase-domain-containing protein [Flammula alnicola]|nr:FAD dependent oxidoreductase-domain-containing protein [Flammula alnicola]